MSKKEVKAWLWLLGVSGTATLMLFLLPVTVIILLMAVFIGMLMVPAPFIFLYSAISFALNALLSRVLPKPVWLRIAMSIAVVVFGAHLVSGLLNTERAAAFNQIVANDVALTSKPSFSRLVLIDEGPETYRTNGAVTCDHDCTTYLANGAVTAVLLPTDRGDTRPLDQRTYTLFRNRPGCLQAQDWRDTGRVWQGGCLAPPESEKIAIGDLVVHAKPVSVPFQIKAHPAERFEVYLMTVSGLQTIERQTSFEMTAYGDMPVMSRDAGWNGSNYDHGLSWISATKPHWRYLENVLKDDLGLSTDLRTRESDLAAASRANAEASAKASAASPGKGDKTVGQILVALILHLLAR
ncbi:hypothetical protein [Asticcacaulis sp. 201]|uniref:hypothetical protein n=1 Tax=Asticcacaulis sp. 201 TaxID=3028787 RepID=UPI0029171010|nr:hypothetical protein [Asticcacaulis sp. 201]MDV6330062.1 hypothetical protein [Asticcacaulis sp. 201]